MLAVLWGTTRQGCTATSVRKWSPLKKVIYKISDTQFAFYCKGLPPTSQIVKNLAEEIISSKLGKNWVGDFVKRYKDRLKSIYLRNIDRIRVKAEYAPIFKQFYDMVLYDLPVFSLN